MLSRHVRERPQGFRVSASHFAPHKLRRHATSRAPDGDAVGVTVVEGALPDQSDSQMFAASKGALGRRLRLHAVAKRHREAWLKAKSSRRCVAVET